MSASSSRYRGRGQPNVEVQHEEIDELTFQCVAGGVSIENLEVVDMEIASAVKDSRHGSVVVEKWRNLAF
jgi:hypothetical protein